MVAAELQGLTGIAIPLYAYLEVTGGDSAVAAARLRAPSPC
jgi:hypothetical protein